MQICPHEMAIKELSGQQRCGQVYERRYKIGCQSFDG